MIECRVIEIPALARPKQALQILDVGNTTLWKLVKQGKLEAVKISGRVTLITGESIKRLVESAPRVNDNAPAPKDAA